MANIDARPRILHAYKSWWPDTEGGIPAAIGSICAACPDAHTEVLACSPEGGSRIVAGVKVRRARSLGTLWSLPVAPTWPVHFWRAAAAADLIAVHVPFSLADLTATLHFPSEPALVVHWHANTVSQRPLGAMLTPFARALLQRADAVVVSSPAMLHNPILNMLQRENIAVVPFGIDVDAWAGPLSASEAGSVAMLRAWCPRLVATVGQLVPYKGFDVLIEAMRNVDAHLMIVGEGPLRARLERLIEDAGVSGRVTLCGRVGQQDLRVILRSARVFAFPSVLPSESFGIAQLEAMACGLPVVNTQLPTGVPWVARDGREALTVSPGQPRVLAEAISTLLENPALAHQMGAAGRARVAKVFRKTEFEQRIRGLYRSVLISRGQTALRSPLLA